LEKDANDNVGCSRKRRNKIYKIVFLNILRKDINIPYNVERWFFITNFTENSREKR